MNGSFSGEIFVETNYFMHLIPHEAKLSNSLLFSKKNKIWHQSGKNAWSTKEPTLGLPSLQQPRWFNGLVFHTRIKTNPFPNCHNVLNLMNGNWTDTSTFPAVTRGTFWKWTLFLPLQKLPVMSHYGSKIYLGLPISWLTPMELCGVCRAADCCHTPLALMPMVSVHAQRSMAHSCWLMWTWTTPA